MSNINLTIEPSVITVTYNPHATTTTPVNCMTCGIYFTSSVYIAPTPISSQVCMFSQPITVQSRISTVYTKTTLISATIGNTNPSISTITLPCSAAILPTTQPNQSSLGSSVVVGGVMGYVIFFILGVVGTVGRFFCGRSSRRQQKQQQQMYQLF